MIEAEPLPTPRTRNASRTRAQILAAAFDAFAESGYSGTGTRDIANRAGVASSLLVRYFGSKASLFEHVLIHAIHTNSIFVGEKARFGEQMAKMVARDSDTRLPALMALAIADPGSRDAARRVARRHILQPLKAWLGPPDAKARAIAMLALLNGFTLELRRLDGDPMPPATIRWLAKALQDIVDGP